jgi:hypothetical protein
LVFYWEILSGLAKLFQNLMDGEEMIWAMMVEGDGRFWRGG